ncbi:MAG: peptide chain release factor N(5)-glutamine methyltransferase [Anaerotignaceae bacterium]
MKESYELPSNKQLKEVLIWGKSILKENCVDTFSLDGELFMMKATGFTKVQLFTKDDYVLSEEELNNFEEMIKKRIKPIPSQYILGECEFMDFMFKVNENVLIPRGDTEILVETILDYAKEYNLKRVLEIGTGSGCIPISLIKYGIDTAVTVDISLKALEVAKENAEINGVYNKIEFVNSNLFTNVKNEEFDAIVSNPPYIATEVISGLQKEVKDQEPMLALDGGADGLDFYRKIIPEGKKYLKENGWMFFEIGYDQGRSLVNLFEENGFTNAKIIKDLAGLDRVAIGRKG